MMSKNNTYYNADSISFNNPWEGLSSYQDPATTDNPKLFCGRKDDAIQLVRLIENNIFVTLYGMSGTGKTSLLKAGVFPAIREDSFLPVSIRLSKDAIGSSFQRCIITKIEQAVSINGKIQMVDVVPPMDDESKPEYLWNYFARTIFYNSEGNVVFPVVVLDQFEENLQSRLSDTEQLLCQISYLMDERHALSSRLVKDEPYEYDFNFRFVIAIREDDLYRLEDSLDKHYLRDMKNSRYRLHNLSLKNAYDVIVQPAGNLIREKDRDSVVGKILSLVPLPDSNEISTILLSLLCSRIYVTMRRNGQTQITPVLLNSFISSNPFESYYQEETHNLSNREKAYIEDNLIDSTGRRTSILESEFEHHIPRSKYFPLCDNSILQRTPVSADGSRHCLELIHDAFGKHLLEQKQKRQQRRKIYKIIVLIIAFVLAILVVYTFFLFRSEVMATRSAADAQVAASKKEKEKLDKEKERLIEENSKRISENEELQGQIKTTKNKLIELSIRKANLEGRVTNLESQRKTDKDSINNLKIMVYTKDKQFQALSDMNQMLKEENENLKRINLDDNVLERNPNKKIDK